MEQININTEPAEPVAEEIVEERPDGTVLRRRVVSQPPAAQVEAGGVTVNVPPAGNGPTNINING